MAYLKPEILTCPNCDYTTEIEVVVGVGPHSQKGDIPYQAHNRRETDVDGPNITCPNAGTVLWTDKPGKKA